MAVERGFRIDSHHACLEPIPHLAHLRRIRFEIVLDELACRAQTGHEDDVLGASSSTRFMVRAVHGLLDGDAVTNVERPNALGSIQLVPGDGQQIDAKVVDFHGYLADRLSASARHFGARPP